MVPRKVFRNLLRHLKEMREKINLIFISIPLSEMHGTVRFKSIDAKWVILETIGITGNFDIK